MKRLSTEYLKTKAAHAVLRALVKPPSELFSKPGYLHSLEGRFLYRLASQVPAGGMIVEIGSFKGKSSGFLAAGLKSNARLTCVDTWCNDAMPYDKAADCMPEFLKNMQAYLGCIAVRRGHSMDIARSWSQPIDLLFIDGDHSYESCSSDLTSWFPHLRRGGWIAFHDCEEDGVARAILEFYPPSMRYSDRKIWSVFAARKR